MTPFIETDRLIIRVPEPSDITHLVELMTDTEVMRYIGNGSIRTHEQINESLEKAIRHYQKHGFSAGCVYEKRTSEFVGRAGLIYLEWDDAQPEIEVAYSLHKNAWGHGYATELARAIIAWGFQHLDIIKLVGITYPDNIASRRVLEKAGMIYIGMVHHYGVDVTKYEIVRD